MVLDPVGMVKSVKTVHRTSKTCNCILISTDFNNCLRDIKLHNAKIQGFISQSFECCRLLQFSKSDFFGYITLRAGAILEGRGTFLYHYEL